MCVWRMHIEDYVMAFIMGTHSHVHTCMHTYTHTYMYTYADLCDGLHDGHAFSCIRTYTRAYTHIQDYVTAFMMGTHSRLGADSPVLLLDPLVAESIAQIIIADKWCVLACVCMHVCMYVFTQTQRFPCFISYICHTAHMYIRTSYVCMYVPKLTPFLNYNFSYMTHSPRVHMYIHMYVCMYLPKLKSFP